MRVDTPLLPILLQPPAPCTMLGGPLTDYTVRFRSDLDRLVGSNTPYLLLSSLLPSTTYHIMVAAHTSVGRGPFSSPISFTTPGEGRRERVREREREGEREGRRERRKEREREGEREGRRESGKEREREGRRERGKERKRKGERGKEEGEKKLVHGMLGHCHDSI